jgi:hypothetical protein
LQPFTGASKTTYCLVVRLLTCTNGLAIVRPDSHTYVPVVLLMISAPFSATSA